MTLLWLLVWFIAGRARPQMFGVIWDFWGITLAVTVVLDTAGLRDWWQQGRHGLWSKDRADRVLRFLWHFVQMAVAMIVGMIALRPVISVTKGAGFPYLNYTFPALHLLVMAVAMSIPMVAWMLYRGHGLERSAEMAGAMFAPALLAIGAHWAGLLSQMEMLSLGHELMWFAMLGLMLWRWNDYAHHANALAPVITPPAARKTGNFTAKLVR
jgi:hypothetical protein